MKKQTKTAFMREAIQEFLKKKNGNWVQQKDIIDALLPGNSVGAGKGVFYGIFGKHQGTGGVHIPISNIDMKKEGSKSYYRYVTPEKTLFKKDSQLYQLAQNFLTFEKELNEEQLFNVDLRELEQEEVIIYLDFIKKFKEIKKNLFKGDY